MIIGWYFLWTFESPQGKMISFTGLVCFVVIVNDRGTDFLASTNSTDL